MPGVEKDERESPVSGFEGEPDQWDSRIAGIDSDTVIPENSPIDSGNRVEFTTLLYSDSFSGEEWVPCDIIITEGDYIGLLGVRGSSNINSYGESVIYPSIIGNIDVNLTRLIYQGPINNGPANDDLFSEPIVGPIARIEMKYSLENSISSPNWLFTDPASGTIPADSTQTIEVTFDATDLAGDDYSADIVISSNDPDENEVVVPVILSVSAYGCTDPEFCNYDPDANIDDGSCTYPGFVCEDGSTVCSEPDCYDCDAEVCLYITNVDSLAGTLDIYMENSEPVAGFQFELFGMTLTGVSDGIAEQYFDFLNFNASTAIIMGVDFSSVSFIPPSSAVLTQVTFTDYLGAEICFGTNQTNNIIADSEGNELYSNWGPCYCGGEYDECGVCNGPGSIYECGCEDISDNDISVGNNVLTLTNIGHDSLHYEFSYTLGELTYEDQMFAERIITGLSVYCLETGESWTFDSDSLRSGNDNHDYSDIMERYENFIPPENRDLDYATLGGYDDDYTGNYHYIWFSVEARDDNGNYFSSYQELDWYPLSWGYNDVSFPNLEFELGSVYDPDDYDTFNNYGYYIYQEFLIELYNELFSVGIDGEVCDCDGNMLDECGVCDGPGPDIECWDGSQVCDTSDCFEFSFNYSTQQAFYFFQTVEINGVAIEPEDWVGAFKGETCVGSRLWGLCGDGSVTCDVPVMGYDGNPAMDGYMMAGEIPTFKIYDASEDIYYPASPSENIPWQNFGMFIIDDLNSVSEYALSLVAGANLVSFYILPDETSIANVIGECPGNITAVLAEGMSAACFDGQWLGTLIEIDLSDGYWIFANNPDTLTGYGTNYDPGRVYDLHYGSNLISYSSLYSASLSSSIPDDVEDLFLAILSEGSGAMNDESLGWVGSLTTFDAGFGYWTIVSDDLSFSYETGSMARSEIRRYVETRPSGSVFNVAQSPHQAFYFVDNITLDKGTIEDGDWLLSYNGNVLTGIRQWQGIMIDIPAMGVGENEQTAGYFEEGDVPTFKLLQQSTGDLIPLGGDDISAWTTNGIYALASLKEMQPIPDDFILNSAYPNPFNPVTTLEFGIPNESQVSIVIYDMQGRLVETLVDQYMDAGYHVVVWNAGYYSSGMYFVMMQADKYIKTQKLMLVK